VLCCRLRLGLLNRPFYEPRQQTQEAREICPRGPADLVDGPCSLQGGASRRGEHRAPRTDRTDETQVAELAGYQRAIINRNPPLIDEDGYDIDSGDDEEQVQEAIASAMEENPYSSIRLERASRPPAIRSLQVAIEASADSQQKSWRR
jgi:hypothetical protein